MTFRNEIGRLQRLMKKYLSGKTSLQETEFFEKWYDHFETRPGDPMTDAAGLAKDRSLLDALNRRIDHYQKGRVVPLYKRKTWKIAASVLIVTGCWLYLRKRPEPSGQAQPSSLVSRTDKAPGTDQAILTLAGGRQIVLGKFSGNSIQADNMTRVQVDSGSVVYRPVRKPDQLTAYNILATPRGGQYRIVLSDGTKVWLNSASSLTFPTQFTTARRSVELTGEAYFEVAPDAAHPFDVKVDQMSVEVLGTSFDVMAYSNESLNKTTLVSGAVRLTDGAGSSLLRPGQQGSVRKGTFSIIDADLDEVLAWKEGKFRFVNSDITTIMRQIARWYDIDVRYEGPLPGKRLSGAFSRKQYVSNLFEALEDVSDAHFSMAGNTVTVTAAPPKP